MLTRIRLTLPLFALALGTLLTACDTTGTTSPLAPAQTLTLQTESAPVADILYDLAPLADGETFAITADAPTGLIRSTATRIDEGYALGFDAGPLAPETVTIRYLYDGVEVAPSRTVRTDRPIEAGVSAQGPDSWHYVCENGSCIWAKDYKQNLTGPGGGTRFTTPDGEVVTVTHVSYTVESPAVAAPTTAPSAIRFESPRDLAITSQVVRQLETDRAIR